MLKATAEANNLTAQVAALDKYNKDMEEVSTLWSLWCVCVFLVVVFCILGLGLGLE